MYKKCFEIFVFVHTLFFHLPMNLTQMWLNFIRNKSKLKRNNKTNNEFNSKHMPYSHQKLKQVIYANGKQLLIWLRWCMLLKQRDLPCICPKWKLFFCSFLMATRWKCNKVKLRSQNMKRKNFFLEKNLFFEFGI